jgi:hypothetical protein
MEVLLLLARGALVGIGSHIGQSFGARLWKKMSRRRASAGGS